jgi:hypothetical protein
VECNSKSGNVIYFSVCLMAIRDEPFVLNSKVLCIGCLFILRNMATVRIFVKTFNNLSIWNL